MLLFSYLHDLNLQQQSTCNDLKMIKLQNLKKFKNCIVAGVACIGCTQHGLFIRMSDLPGGERLVSFVRSAYSLSCARFCCVDYAFGSALQEVSWWLTQTQADDEVLIKLGYDLWCQYKVNLSKRVQENKTWLPGLTNIVEALQGIIGLVHIMNHVLRCMALYSAPTTPNVGHLVVDSLEQRFSETKITGGSTKHMNPGHRHDTLDDYHNYWNWVKVLGFSKAVFTHMSHANSVMQAKPSQSNMSRQRNFTQSSSHYSSNSQTATHHH